MGIEILFAVHRGSFSPWKVAKAFSTSMIDLSPWGSAPKDVSVARTYAKVQVDGLALKATNNEKGSYISAAKKIVEDVMDQWEIEQERILHSDSLGIRAVIGTVTSTTVVIASAPYGITGAGIGNREVLNLENIYFSTICYFCR